MTAHRAIGILISCFLAGACAGNAPQAPDVANVYLGGDQTDTSALCDAMREEVAVLDAGLGGPATEPPPPVAAGAGARWGAYGKNVIVQTVIGPLQPLIQTWKSASNYDDKKRMTAARAERASLRRAYLLGAMDGADCAD